jgi:hypothetical protein
VWMAAQIFACALTAWISLPADAQQISNKPKKLATNLKGFGIPFRINADDESFIEVQLYLSTDQGKTWRFHDRQTTDKAEFPFQAQGDGEYWFAIKTLNRNRQLIPEGKPAAELIIIVDTVLPELEIDISADAAGRIECRWKASDKNLKADSVQLSYQPIGAASDDWKMVPVNLTGMVRNGSYTDQLAWWPETTEQSLNVRVSIADQAGNTVSQERRINIAQSPWRHRAQSTARTGDAMSSGQVLTSPPSSEVTPTPVFPFPENNDSYTQNRKTSPFDPASGDNALNNIVCENGVCSLAPQTGGLNRANEVNPVGLRVAGGTQSGHEPPLVGSPPVISAPPHPDLYGAVADNRSNSAYAAPASSSTSGRNGVSWQSETENWTRQNKTTSSTVRSPPIQSELAPQLPDSRPDNPALPNPNPNRMTRSEQTVVGESSTNSPNQYRGLPPQNQPIALPEFLTGEEAENWVEDKTTSNPSVPSEAPDSQNQPIGERNQFSSAPAGGQGSVPRSDQQNRSQSQPAQSPPVQKADPLRDSQQSLNHLASSAAGSGYRQVPDSVVDQLPGFSPSVQMVASKRFRLNYAIDAIDPSGVARVDLWMTRDGGRTWKSWGTDPDNVSPFPVEVDEEGQYGFRIVIHSKDGLTGRAPSNGDQPDIYIQVDTQAPLAQIISVPYGRGEEAGRLIINYRVSDPHLTLRPISLYYSTNPSGSWTPIEEGLRNESRYVWKPASNVPDRVFLRLDAMDRATNKGSHTLSQAIDVSGLVPRGTIQGVVPVGGN